MKQMSEHAKAAKMIRQELRISFPNVKFGIQSGISGSTHISISWGGGPEAKEVRDIIDKYKAGRFNGVEDIYEYSNKSNDLPKVDYIFTTRSREV